ncbi:hypothetical protein H6771_00140 [Candidatus Peribacteria bacterium]|nr:hypothetical protein [Candidatus Peribacteria bacterium]
MLLPKLHVVLHHLTKKIACPRCGTPFDPAQMDILVRPGDAIECRCQCQQCQAQVTIAGRVQQKKSTATPLSEQTLSEIGTALENFHGGDIRELFDIQVHEDNRENTEDTDDTDTR